MRREITNSALWQIDSDIQSFVKQHPGIIFLLSTPVKNFYTKNKMTLKILNDKMHAIQKKFIEHDKDDRALFADVKEGQTQVWKYLESAIDKTGKLVTGDDVAKAYDEEAKEFLERSVYVEV